MMRRRSARGRVIALLLFLLAAAGAGVLGLYRSNPDLFVLRLGGATGQLGSTPISSEGTQGAQQPAATEIPPETRFAVIALRPLFVPERLPPEQEAEPSGDSGDDSLSDIVVTGIVMAGEDSIAIAEPARPGSKGAKFVLRVGDTVSGWTVEAIELDRIVLLKGDERGELELKKDESPPPRRTPQRTERRANPQQQNPQRPRVLQPQQPAQQPARQ
jgi:hypothetical protein